MGAITYMQTLIADDGNAPRTGSSLFPENPERQRLKFNP
jgi:hypothetical protein